MIRRLVFEVVWNVTRGFPTEKMECRSRCSLWITIYFQGNNESWRMWCFVLFLQRGIQKWTVFALLGEDFFSFPPPKKIIFLNQHHEINVMRLYTLGIKCSYNFITIWIYVELSLWYPYREHWLHVWCIYDLWLMIYDLWMIVFVLGWCDYEL